MTLVLSREARDERREAAASGLEGGETSLARHVLTHANELQQLLRSDDRLDPPAGTRVRGATSTFAHRSEEAAAAEEEAAAAEAAAEEIGGLQIVLRPPRGAV